TYPFERKRYWVERPETTSAAGVVAPVRMVVPAAAPGAASKSEAAPRNAVELTICRIWQEILGTEAIGIHDDLFELGGSSLVAGQILARVRRAFEVDLSLVRMLGRPTIAHAAEQVEALLLERVAALPEDEAERLLERLDAAE